MTPPPDKLAFIRNSFPAEGLFADKEWLISPESFPLTPEFVVELEKLGYRLNLFNRACNQLYQLSAQGRQPSWIAEYLDRGKPPELIALSRAKATRNEVPRVIRPDLVLTDAGFTIAEIDSVPGGIGLTAWLSRTYSSLGDDVLGGSRGLIDGFREILPKGAEIVVSDEAATYRPEMQWLARELRASGGGYAVRDAENYETPPGGSVYRFFELFDVANLPRVKPIMAAAERGEIEVTPPFKPYLEEKMWFALFWLRPLREFWRRELGERHFLKLQESIPYTWIIDPAPLPQHAVIPNLEIQDWRELGDFSQKERELILKISGFSPTAWGSRGVVLGQDLPQQDWKAAVDDALATFESNPHILQRFHKGRLIEHPFFAPETGVVQTMRGRVRLCPFYFVIDGKAQLRGALATICPADKKLLHGMKDAILVPARVG